MKPQEQVFFTKKKDYNSSPSFRVKFEYGLTFVNSDLATMGIPLRNEVVRLKNGNFLIKFDYKVLKIYWNLTKERIERVFRIDYPSEIPSILVGHELRSYPNINFLKKFYLKTLNFQTSTLELSMNTFFKKYTNHYFKKYETVQFLPGTSKIYFEANRQVDKYIYPKNSIYSRTTCYNKLYNKLQCIEFDYLTKRCIVYRLDVDKD